jgi:hypothetical protein
MAAQLEQGADTNLNLTTNGAALLMENNRRVAKTVLNSAKREYDELTAARPTEDAGELAYRDWNAKQIAAINKILLAARCVETGEDVNSMLGQR